MQLIDSRHSFIEIFVCVFHICPREHKGFLFINNIYYLPIKIFVSQIHLADTNKFIFGHTVLCLLVAVFYLFILFYFFLNLYLFIYQGGIANFCKPKKKKKNSTVVTRLIHHMLRFPPPLKIPSNLNRHAFPFSFNPTPRTLNTHSPKLSRFLKQLYPKIKPKLNHVCFKFKPKPKSSLPRNHSL